MQEYDELDCTLVAEPPTIPTYRPSSQSSKRIYTMSALAPKYQQYLSMADEIQTTDKSHARPSNENVKEIVRYLQTHTSPQGNSQSTGARDMIKAGQRRLKLALRNNKKVTDSKGKPDDAARQWAALQQEGYFPRSRYRKPEQKKDAASVTSNSKSVVSDLGCESSSKLDAETMGQPWLDNPLETRDAPGSKGSSSQLSSLDFRDLASFVEAAVNFSSEFDGSNPPPYQTFPEQHSKPAGTATPMLDLNLRTDAPPMSNLSTTTRNSADISRSNSSDLYRTQSGSPHQSTLPSGQQNSDNQPPTELRPTGDTSTPSRSPPTGSSTSSKGSSAPPTPVLKLFPDTMPPRISSKGVLRVPTGRSPTPSQSPFQAPVPQTTSTLAAVFESRNRDSINSSNSLPKTQEYATSRREEKPHISVEPEKRPENTVESEESQHTQVKHPRRPSSLPPDAINAFPIPAPIKPLPTVPEPSRAHRQETRRLSADQPTDQVHSKRTDSELQGREPPHISVSTPSSPGKSKISSRGRASPFPRLRTEDTGSPTIQGAVEAAALLGPRRSSLGKAGRSREEKVRSLIIRDLAASRVNNSSGQTQKPESPPTAPQELRMPSSPRSETSTLGAHRQYQRKVSPSPSSPPPALPASDPPRHGLQGRRYVTPTTSTMATTIENFENLSRPAADRNAHVSRKPSVRGAEPKHGRRSMEQNIYDDNQAEAPLPSSDDECPTGAFYWNPPQKTTKRRRPRPAPILVDEPSSRGRTLKKRHDTGGLSPLTPQGHRARASEKTHHAHPAPVGHQSHNAHAYPTAETKPNPSLEGRIEHLERQNKILQAALLAALDVGVKQDLSSLLGASAASMSTNATPPLTGRSFSTTTTTSISEVQSTGKERRGCNYKASYRPESWITSPDQFRKDGYESEDSADVRDLEEMMDDFDLDWLSDRSSNMG
ncbi:hypothetical protein BJX63DRAFT_333885 [Aspergillus granulosus]|uniref:Uncharacterized protein n=1 Tax=Aspergillus granulosus TaxID=176169 RepID=A0ABR4HX39_9EURO